MHRPGSFISLKYLRTAKLFLHRVKRCITYHVYNPGFVWTVISVICYSVHQHLTLAVAYQVQGSICQVLQSEKVSTLDSTMQTPVADGFE